MDKIREIKIPKDEVLRYLGYKKQKMDDSFLKLIDETIKEAEDIIELKYLANKYKIELKDAGVLIEGTNLLLIGNDIKEHLKNSQELILIAVTLGRNIEKKYLIMKE